ncbi:MAG TPA: polysaccharide deacetylase family protein [Chthoniobacterales bacterium]|nr:polysaccharide deacetylase family protein [Chthoniobacterales bacterium]
MTGASATSLPSLFALSAEAERAALVVSIHDVAPSTQTRVEEIVSELAHHGVAVSSLLVVPNYHQRGCSIEDRAFVRWLQDLETKGHEIVIHGYFHERARREGETVSQKLWTRFYTGDEGEFYDLDYDEALRRITRAREEFTAAGLTPRGFIAPAWLLGAPGERAAADADLEYTTRLTGVRDLRSGETYPARTLAYSTRAGWRRTTSLAWNNLLVRQLAEAPLARVSIHPPDRDHPEIWRQILRLTDRLLENRNATTYRDWIAEKRAKRRA